VAHCSRPSHCSTWLQCPPPKLYASGHADQYVVVVVDVDASATAASHSAGNRTRIASQA